MRERKVTIGRHRAVFSQGGWLYWYRLGHTRVRLFDLRALPYVGAIVFWGAVLYLANALWMGSR